MPVVAPSILSADFANLAKDCCRVLPKSGGMLHFDVMDGVFVPNLSIGMPVLASLKKALPDVVYDVHLMIVDPARYVEAFAKAGADFITFHAEAQGDAAGTARAVRAAGCKAGVSLRPKTPVEDLFPLLDEVDMVLVMSVEPGFGGQSFMPAAVGRIAALKKEIAARGLPVQIEVDGGIDPNTAPLCVNAGADLLVAGSAVFGAADPADVMRRMGYAPEGLGERRCIGA